MEDQPINLEEVVRQSAQPMSRAMSLISAVYGTDHVLRRLDVQYGRSELYVTAPVRDGIWLRTANELVREFSRSGWGFHKEFNSEEVLTGIRFTLPAALSRIDRRPLTPEQREYFRTTRPGFGPTPVRKPEPVTREEAAKLVSKMRSGFPKWARMLDAAEAASLPRPTRDPNSGNVQCGVVINGVQCVFDANPPHRFHSMDVPES